MGRGLVHEQGALTIGSSECYEFTKFAKVEWCDPLCGNEFVGRFNDSSQQVSHAPGLFGMESYWPETLPM